MPSFDLENGNVGMESGFNFLYYRLWELCKSMISTMGNMLLNIHFFYGLDPAYKGVTFIVQIESGGQCESLTLGVAPSAG